jgi:hypothetical protein
MRRPPALLLAFALAGMACGGGPEDQFGVFPTPLQQAVKAHDVGRVRELLAKKARLGRSARIQLNAWHLSLLEIRDDDPRTIEVAALVLDAMAAHTGSTPVAVVNQDILLHSTETSRHRNRPRTYVSPAEEVAKGYSDQGLRFLVDKGLDPRGPGARAAFSQTIAMDCVRCAVVLLDAGTPVDTRDEQGRMPLAVARGALNTAMTALLSSRGAAGRVLPSATAEQATRRVTGPKGGQETWIEGAAIAEHPAGQQVLGLAGQRDVKNFPPAAAVQAGFAAGSVLLTHPTETEIQLVRFPQDDPRPGARTTVMELRVRPRPDGGFTIAFEH